MTDYPLERKPEIFEETVYIVHDPMIAQDVASFSSEKDAKRFAKQYYKRGRGMPSALFLEQRNELLLSLRSLDAEIDAVLAGERTTDAAVKAKRLFDDREHVAELLAGLGVDVEPHVAVWSRG